MKKRQLTIAGLLACICCRLAVALEYSEVSYQMFMQMLDELKTSPMYDRLFKVTNAFEAYRIDPIPLCGSHPCQNPLIEISDTQQGQEATQRLPTVLLIGGFHGDEVVGTDTLYYLIKFINDNYLNRNDLISLLGNVRLLVLPMANVNGFYHFKRTETVATASGNSEEDPNRDFPYDQPSGNRCFVTSTAKLLEAIFKSNIVVSCLTFHGGENSISYPWGNYYHQGTPQTGDHRAFSVVAKVLQQVAGRNSNVFMDTYKIGTMHDIVYDVHGGFEDWAYGSSFEGEHVNTQCGFKEPHGRKLIGSNIEYNQITNKAFIFLVEAGMNKRPPSENLGNDAPLISGNFNQGKWGHVTRNIHLSLTFAKVTAPFMVIKKVSYGKSLQVKADIHGCSELNSISVQGFKSRLLKKDYRARANNFSILFEISMAQGVYKEIVVDLTCDQSWAKEHNGLSPQSHLVRSRTDPAYAVSYNGFSLQSQKVIKTKMVNVRTSGASKALIQNTGRNIFSLTFAESFIGAPLSKGKGKALNLRYQNTKAAVYMDSLQRKAAHRVALNVPPVLGSSKALAGKATRRLAKITEQKYYTISAGGFLALNGRKIKLHDLSNTSHLDEIIILPRARSVSKENRNALFMPSSGLKCVDFRYQSRARSFSKVFVTIHPDFQGMSFSINVYDRIDGEITFKVGSFTGIVPIVGTRSQRSQVSHHRQILVPVTTLDDFRLLGRKFAIDTIRSKTILSCRLGVLDSTEASQKVWGFRDSVESQKPPSSSWKTRLLLAFLCSCSVVGYFIYKKKLQKAAAAEIFNEAKINIE